MLRLLKGLIIFAFAHLGVGAAMPTSQVDDLPAVTALQGAAAGVVLTKTQTASDQPTVDQTVQETTEPYTDHRAWQHGIDLLKVGSRYLLVWSSWGNPPTPYPNEGSHWQHDVFYSWIDPSRPFLNIQTLAADDEAQEPASAAINTQGRILMSCEDGKGEINQHAGLWDSQLNTIKPYPFTIRNGGHSGHVAALGDRFLVVYSEGWIEGGGVDNLGTGDDVWARIVDNDGNTADEIPVSVDSGSEMRDWWPVVGASDRNWLMVWQRYPSGTLQAALIDYAGTIQKQIQITDNIKYYYYNVRYLPSLKRYAVFGSREDGGFVSLLDTEGNIVTTTTGLPDTVRESKLITNGRGRQLTAVYPTLPNGAAVLHITDRSVSLARTIVHPYQWDYMGTDGLFVGPRRVLFTTLSKSGLQFIPIRL